MFSPLRLVVATSLAVASLARADEGMWLFTAPPKEPLKAKYGFDVTQEWMDNLRLSSVRLNAGGSGSWVSQDGLLITNHHVGFDAIQKLSTEKRNLIDRKSVV